MLDPREVRGLQVVGKERRLRNRGMMAIEGVVREFRAPCCLGLVLFLQMAKTNMLFALN